MDDFREGKQTVLLFVATAASLPDRVTGVLSIAGVGPADAADLDFLAGMGKGNIEEFRLAAQGESPLRANLTPSSGGFAGDPATWPRV